MKMSVKLRVIRTTVVLMGIASLYLFLRQNIAQIKKKFGLNLKQTRSLSTSAMFSAKEYTHYNALKMGPDFKSEIDIETFKQSRKEKFRKWIPEILEPYQKICDYGAGSGWLKELCTELGKECIEVDDIAGQNKFADIEPVDLVCCITVLEHMTPEQIDDFISTATTKTKSLFLVTNNPRCLFSHFVLWDDFTHTRLYSERAIGALLRAKGYEIVRVFYQDNVLEGFKLTQEQIQEFNAVAQKLKPIFLSSPYNYWCMLAKAPTIS